MPQKALIDIYRQICELVMSTDVSVVGCEGHQEVDEGEDDQGAGHRRQDKHHLCNWG